MNENYGILVCFRAVEKSTQVNQRFHFYDIKLHFEFLIFLYSGKNGIKLRLITKPGWIFPSREFSCNMYRIPTHFIQFPKAPKKTVVYATLGNTIENLQEFSPSCFPGHLDNLLVLQSVGPEKTKLTLCVEVDARGFLSGWNFGLDRMLIEALTGFSGYAGKLHRGKRSRDTDPHSFQPQFTWFSYWN